MNSTTVRVTEATWKTIREIARNAGLPMQEIVERAVEEYRRNLLLEQANSAFAALKNDPGKWEEELEERRAWDETLADDLEETP